ncbi:MAG: glycosyltransferase family 9 protein [bacterium]|nr:glycosyltransferase family 9 protein [bacterium]
MSKIKKDEIKKILCIKPRGIGDIILSTIVLENLKDAFPHSEIHYLTEEFAKRAVENNPFISKVLTFNKEDFILSTIRKVRKEKYDLILDLWSNPKTAQITFFSGAKYRVGFEKRGRNYAYNYRGKNGTMGNHAAEDNLVLLNELDIPIISKKILFKTNSEERSFAKKLFEQTFPKKGTIIIGIIPSGGWDSKRCEVSKWIEICKEIQKKFDAHFLILWGPGDEKDAEEIRVGLTLNPILAPNSSFGQMSALIEKCDLVIANDSGPMHAAAALNIPTIGIFGPTNPENHRPYSEKSGYVIHSELHCIKCNKLVCPYGHECMFELPTEKFLIDIDKLLNQQ